MLSEMEKGDEAVMASNDDAATCKRSAVLLGYWQDEYITEFVPQPAKRAPEINRGYYARVKGVESLVRQFISIGGVQSQIISLGAGYDTLYWRLHDDKTVPECHGYYEVDFPAITLQKRNAIRRSEKLMRRFACAKPQIGCTRSDMHIGNYHLISADLRFPDQLEFKLKNVSDFDFNRPTLFITECVLTYMSNAEVSALVNWIAARFSAAVVISYEMCNLDDSFGEMVLKNLQIRGFNLLNEDMKRVSLDFQQNRFLCPANKWWGVRAWDMVRVYQMLPKAEIARIEKIEFFDERELLVQLLEHYSICVSWIGEKFNTHPITLDENEIKKEG